jgi:CHAT domain-containing protein
MMGLRRSFRQAGARTVISSLWPVSDEATAELMKAFYLRLWEKGKNKSEALVTAQRNMLKKLRENGEASPRLWGAFVLSGDWR